MTTHGFRRGQRVRIPKAYVKRYPQSKGRVIEPTSLGIAVRVLFEDGSTDWIEIDHLEKRQ